MESSSLNDNNKRIVKNTIALCLRMFVTMGIGVYASRVLLQNLGVTDYGVYNVVGGVIGFFGFLNATMMDTTQRYLNFELGVGNNDKINGVFSTSLSIHAIVAVTVFILGETIGVYAVNNILDIPADRLAAANWVLQFTILSTIINVMSVPYNSLIIAYERMSIFAVVTVAQLVLTLAICIAIEYVGFDRLIVYSALISLLHIAVRLYYGYYCGSRFRSVRFVRSQCFSRIKEMSSFSAWTLIGAFSYMAYTQGLTFLFNIFFGPVVNAAQALAHQVKGSLDTFGANYLMAVKPQITKSYAEGNMQRMKSLFFFSSKFSFLIMLTVSLPFFIRTEYVLDLWLTEVPEHTVSFLRLSLITSVWLAFAGASACVIKSNGDIKWTELTVSAINLLILPLTYLVLMSGANPESAYIVQFIMLLTAQMARFYFLKLKVNMRLRENIFMVIRLTISALASYAVTDIVSMLIPMGIIGFLTLCVLSVLFTSTIWYAVALDSLERKKVYNLVLSQINKILNINK